MIAIAMPRDAISLPTLRRHPALALSALLHGALMAAWLLAPASLPHDPGDGALSVELVLPPPSPEPPSPPEPSPEPQPAKTIAPPAPPKPAPKPLPAKPAPVAAATISAPAAVETAAQQPLLTESNAPVAEPATTQAAPPVAVGGPAGRAAERDDYVRLLWSRIMRFRPERVPFAGTARLHFTLGADGSLQAVEISASSGSGLLDRIALDAVKRASPFPLPPADLPMDMLTFEIPFQFR